MNHPERSRDATGWFATAALAAASVALVAVFAVAVTADGTASERVAVADQPAAETAPQVDLDDGAVADPDASGQGVVLESASAMAQVTSVEFTLERDGAPIYIDQFESIALDSLIGQFTVPGQAAAALDVQVDGNLNTRIGAIALDDEVWISNPVTGDFETLPAGYDIDPSRFFDPEGGWQPLLANLTDVELVGVEDRGGDRYHVRGMAPAAEVQNITVGLVRNQVVPVDLWIHPASSLVTHAEFVTVIDGAESTWKLELARYGEPFTIEAPANVRNQQ